jgi:replicative DNA helicase
MIEKQLMYKLISSEANISVYDVRTGNIPAHFMSSCKIQDAQLTIYDKGDLTLDELISIAKYEAKSKDIKMIIIDYLQLLGLGIYAKKGQTRENEVSTISRKLKQLAMTLQVPVIALSQLNRDKTRKTYRLHDLRESGAIEQDADNVWFIFRPNIHDMDEYNLGNEKIQCNERTAIFIVEKCRLGETGQIEMRFNGACSRFEDTEGYVPISNNQTPF